MRKTFIAFFLGISLALIPAAVPPLSPSPAAAAEARIASEKPDLGLWLVDLILVRPGSIAVLAVFVATYPIAVLLDPLFGDDPEKLQEEWLTKPFAYAFERPLGNFRWEKR